MKNSCIMVVDDSEADQFLTKLAIEDLSPNTSILQAYDGVEAIDLLKEHQPKPEIILLDINMPRMDGHEFLHEYAQLEGEKSAVIAILTSSNHDKDRQQALQFNFVRTYILKPLEESALKELIKETI